MPIVGSAAIIGSSSGISYCLRVLSCKKILLRVYANDSNVFSLTFGFSSHSQIVMECQPIAASSCCTLASRSWFLCIFATQKSLFVFGILQHSELSIVNGKSSNGKWM